MTNTLSCLVDAAININAYFKQDFFMIHHYDDGSYVELRVNEIKDFPRLLELCDGHYVRVFARDDSISIILYEKK